MANKRGRPKKQLTVTTSNEVIKTVIGSSQLYTARIKVLGVFYTATGSTCLEAITNLKVPKALGTSILTVSREDKSQEKVFNSIQTVRLFSTSPTVRNVAIKNTLSRFSL